MNTPISDNTLHGRTLARADLAALTKGQTPSRLIECEFGEEDLSDLDLTGWSFERCDLRHAKLAGARLEGSIWQSCRGAFADFTRADLTDATFASSDFNNAALRFATLTSASFKGCKLTGADLSEASVMSLHFEETLLISAKLPSLSFRKQTLQRVDFSQSDLRKCDFRATVFQGCSLRDANVAGARFDNADLRGADLGGIRLIDAGLFRGATISHDQAGQLLAELGLKLG